MTVTPAPELVRTRRLADYLRIMLFSPLGRRGWGLCMTLVALVVAVKALSLSPSGPSFGWDKANHMAAFAVLAFCGLFTFRERARPIFWVSFLLLAFGVAIEIGQMYVPGRSADPEDVFADSLGIAAGLLMAGQIARWADRRKRPRRAGDETTR